MNKNLFRNKAIENQTMPERLDHSLRLTKPRYWVAVVAGIIVVATLIVWGFVGTINSTVDVYGYYMCLGNTNSSMMSEPGQVLSANDLEGKIVYKGDVIFTYKNTLDEIKDWKAESTGILVKDNLSVGQQLIKGQQIYFLRAFIVEENGKQVLYDESSQKNSKVDYSSLDKKIYLYVPSTVVSDIEIGQEVRFKDNSGIYMKDIKGKISKVKKTNASEEEIASITGMSINSKAVSQLTDGCFCECEIDVPQNALWPYNEGDMLQASVITGKIKPINLVFPDL